MVSKHLVLFLAVVVQGFVLTPIRSYGEEETLIHVDSANRICGPVTAEEKQ